MAQSHENRHTYPHHEGSRSDEKLRQDAEANPDAYGAMLGHIDAYLAGRAETHEDSVDADSALGVFAADALERHGEVVDTGEAVHEMVSSPEMLAVIEIMDDLKNMEDDTPFAEVFKKIQRGIVICREDISWEDELPRDLRTFVGALERYNDSVAGRGADAEVFASGILATLIPREIVQRMYSEDEESHNSIQSIIENTSLQYPDARRFTLDNLGIIYGSKKGVRNLVTGQDAVVDKIRRLYGTDFRISMINRELEGDTPEDLYRHNRDIYMDVRDTFHENLQLPDDTFESFWAAAESRLHEFEDERHLVQKANYNGSYASNALFNIKRLVDVVGRDEVVRISKALGVVNLDMYEPDDFKAIGYLLDHDKGYINHLNEGDVTVVFRDAYGDHNGALNSSNLFRHEGKRTIFFEVSQPSDVYRQMIRLKKLGIKPSTVVINTHGLPGRAVFGNGTQRGSFEAISNDKVTTSDDRSTINVSKMQLGRLTSDEFMQESRGLDDGEDIKGRKRIIMACCSSDVEFSRAASSLAESVARGVGKNDVDVYGASKEVVVRSAGDKGGVKFAPILELDSTTKADDTPSIGNRLNIDGTTLFGSIKGMNNNGKRFKIKRTLVERVY